MELLPNPSEWEFTVKNAKTEDSEIPSEVCIDYYYKTKKMPPKSHDECPSCGKTMYRKKFYPNTPDKGIMVGGHVEFYTFKWILPMCKECNDKKQALQPFKVKLGKLCPLPKKRPLHHKYNQ